MAQVLPDLSNLPLAFCYDEGDPHQERLHFKVWDRRSFVLGPERLTVYAPPTREKAQRGWQQFTDERNDVFLEFVKTEPLEGNAALEGLWFADLLKLGLLGSRVRYGNAQEVAERQAWLHQWGYGEGNSGEQTAPLSTQVPKVLSWPDPKTKGGQGSMGGFVAQAQRRTRKVQVPFESLYAAATFGLLALDLLTTTGMRSNELQQVNVLPECFIRLVDEPPPGARDQAPHIRYVLGLLPKRERTEERHNYGMARKR